jgi:hypothetical protein
MFQSGLVNIMCGYGAQELPVSYIHNTEVKLLLCLTFSQLC